MSKINRIKSNKYKNNKIQFGSFVLSFDKHGISEVEIKNSDDQDSLDNIVKSFNLDICYLEDSENELLEAKKEKDLNYYISVLKSKEEEIEALKLSNENLSIELTKVKSELKAYKEINKNKSFSEKDKESTIVDKVIDIIKEEPENGEKKDLETDTEKEDLETDTEKEGKEEDKINYDDLNKKTIVELKNMLIEIFSEFKEEWKPLSKKEDIILYIMNKVEIK